MPQRQSLKSTLYSKQNLVRARVYPITTNGTDLMDGFIDALQWPAMAVTLVSAWLVASQSKQKRAIGFWCFISSNILWIIWGWHDGALALIALQIGLFAMNLRGAMKNEDKSAES